MFIVQEVMYLFEYVDNIYYRVFYMMFIQKKN